MARFERATISHVDKPGQFPREILAKIFRECALNEPDGFTTGLGWIKVTHVCGLWRYVACADQQLWSRITSALGRQWIDTKLSRAHSAPLSVRVDSSWTKLPRRTIGSLLRNHMSHIKELSLELNAKLCTTDLTQELRKAFLIVAPCLTSLYISCLKISLPVPVLSPNAFVERLPALRSLTLAGDCLCYEKDFKLTPPCGLVEINIALYRSLSVAQLSSLLLASSNTLKKLWLRAPSLVPLPNTAVANSIHLPNLEDLRLEGTPAQCATFLTALNLHPVRCLSVNCGLMTPDEREEIYPLSILPILFLVPAMFQPSTPLQRLSVESIASSVIAVSGSQCLDDDFEFFAGFPHDGTTPNDKLEVFASLPLQDVMSFSVKAIDCWGDDLGDWIWNATSGSLPNAESLTVEAFIEDSTLWGGFFHALSPPIIPENPAMPPPPPSYPSLAELTIKISALEEDGAKLWTEWIDCLSDVLEPRDDVEARIERLRLDVHIPGEIEDVYEALKGIARHVFITHRQ